MHPYTAKNGRRQFKPSLEDLQAAVEDGTTGFCLACGAERTQTEPDVRRGRCDCCGEAKVYGAEELMLMNLWH